MKKPPATFPYKKNKHARLVRNLAQTNFTWTNRAHAMHCAPPASLSWSRRWLYLPAQIPPSCPPHAQKTICSAAEKSVVSPSALLLLSLRRRGCFLQTHSLTYDSLQGNSWQLVSWVCGINSRQSPRWVMMGRLDGCWHGATLIGPAAAWRQEAGNKAGLELYEQGSLLGTQRIPAYTRYWRLRASQHTHTHTHTHTDYCRSRQRIAASRSWTSRIIGRREGKESFKTFFWGVWFCFSGVVNRIRCHVKVHWIIYRCACLVVWQLCP